MSDKKTERSKRETVALEALRHGMAVIKRGNETHALYPDGSSELLSRSHSKHHVWQDALDALRSREKSGEQEDADVGATDTLVIYTDGGSRGNPGPSASGYVILNHDESRVLERGGEYLGITTNNQAEYQAVKHGLEVARKFDARHLVFYIDSLLVVNQLNGVFKVKNQELWPVHEAIRELTESYETVTFTHVNREQNLMADDEVNKILDAQNSLSDNE